MRACRIVKAPSPAVWVLAVGFGLSRLGWPAQAAGDAGQNGPAVSLEATAEAKAATIEAKDPDRPKVVELSPANDSEGVESDCALHIRFDRPMDPMSLKLGWTSGGFISAGDPSYDSNRYEFTIPVQLDAGSLQRIILNQPLLGVRMLAQSRKQFPLEGFHSTDRRQAALAVWQFRTRPAPAAGKGPPPKPISISPPPGSTATLLTFFDVQFDQPMMAGPNAVPWLGPQTNIWKRAGVIPYVQYNPSNHSFRVPLLLPPQDPIRFKLGHRTFELPRIFTPNEVVAFMLEGFRSAGGVPAAPIAVHYRVADVEMIGAQQDELEGGVSDPRLLELLAAMKQRRSQLHSLAERVQTFDVGEQKGLFTSYNAACASFQMQSPGCYYGDVTENMLSCDAFKIGSDGKEWWFLCGGGGGNLTFEVCPAQQMHIRDLSFADPFHLVANSPSQAAASERLIYAGMTNVAGVDYHLVESWRVESIGGMSPWGSFKQWWIDARTLRLAQLVEFHGFGMLRTRFLYDKVNQPLLSDVFAVPKGVGSKPSPPDVLDANYTRRLVIIHDGADGRMSERWGKRGPKGMSSSGLN